MDKDRNLVPPPSPDLVELYFPDLTSADNLTNQMVAEALENKAKELQGDLKLTRKHFEDAAKVVLWEWDAEVCRPS